MGKYNRPEFLYDFKLKKVFINYNTEGFAPDLLTTAGGEIRKNPYNGNPGFMMCGNKNETPENLISRVLDDFKGYTETKYKIAVSILEKGKYTELINWQNR